MVGIKDEMIGLSRNLLKVVLVDSMILVRTAVEILVEDVGEEEVAEEVAVISLVNGVVDGVEEVVVELTSVPSPLFCLFLLCCTFFSATR